MAPQAAETWHIAGRPVRVSNLQKVFWADDGLTKGDMLRYYQAVAPTMLPHLKDRPVTLVVYPNGTQGSSYYRRGLPAGAPPWLRSADYEPETGEGITRLPAIDDAAGLVWLANKGSIEFHTWGSRLPDLAEPDQVIVDLDPGDEATFADVLRAALPLRDALARLGLKGYPKTSGGRGLHVFLPLARGYTFDAVRAWDKFLAEQLAAAAPELIAVAHGATHRGRQVTVDYAQNSIGRNTAAPYTLRALPGAPVSAPLTWEEVEEGQVRPAHLTLRTLPDRLQRQGDLFAPMLQAGQHLPSQPAGNHQDTKTHRMI